MSKQVAMRVAAAVVGILAAGLQDSGHSRLG